MRSGPTESATLPKPAKSVRRSASDQRIRRLSEQLRVAIDIGGRGGRRHQRHVVERSDENAAIQQEQVDEGVERSILPRRCLPKVMSLQVNTP